MKVFTLNKSYLLSFFSPPISRSCEFDKHARQSDIASRYSATTSQPPPLDQQRRILKATTLANSDCDLNKQDGEQKRAGARQIYNNRASVAAVWKPARVGWKYAAKYTATVDRVSYIIVKYTGEKRQPLRRATISTRKENFAII